MRFGGRRSLINYLFVLLYYYYYHDWPDIFLRMVRIWQITKLSEMFIVHITILSYITVIDCYNNIMRFCIKYWNSEILFRDVTARNSDFGFCDFHLFNWRISNIIIIRLLQTCTSPYYVIPIFILTTQHEKNVYFKRNRFKLRVQNDRLTWQHETIYIIDC